PLRRRAAGRAGSAIPRRVASEGQLEAGQHRPGLRGGTAFGLQVLVGHGADQGDARAEGIGGSPLVGFVLVVARYGRTVRLAVEIGERDAPGAGLVGGADVERAAGVGAHVVAAGVGAAHREAGIADVRADRPEAGVGAERRFVLGEVVAAGDRDIDAL